jgi:hypothetical protein
MVSLESLSGALKEIPIMQYYAGDSLNQDPSNYWAPNAKCMEMMLVDGGFSPVMKKVYGSRAIFKCKVNTNSETKWQSIQRGKQLPGEGVI